MSMEVKLFIEDILFIIVLYKKALNESESFAGIEPLGNQRGAMCSVFLYDNSPDTLLPEGMYINGEQVNHPNKYLHLFYRHDPQNSGVSKAYNEGLPLAKRLGKKWMMLLDQDTELDPEVFAKFHQASNAFPEEVAFVPILRDRFGIVSPFRWRFGRGNRPKIMNKLTLPLRHWRFMNSGLLVSVKAFENCGGYDERIRLDFSDIVFGERLAKLTSEFRVVDFELHHRFSGTDNTSIDVLLTRYQQFCIGSMAFGQYSDRVTLSISAFLRGLKLSVYHSDFSFVKIFFQTRQQ